MSGIRRMLLSCGVATALMLNGSPSYAAETAPPPKTMDPGAPDVMALVTLPNFNSLCDHVEALGSAFNPEGVQPGMIKAMLSQKFTEPVLANIDGSKPITALILPPTPGALDGGPADFVFFIPAKSDAPMAAMVKEAKAEMAFQDGIIITSQSAAGLEKGKAMLATYKKLDAEKITSDARIYINTALVNKMFGPMLQMMAAGGMEKLKKDAAGGPAPGGPPIPPELLHKIVLLYFKGGLGLLNQSNAMQLDLSFDATKIKTDYIFQAKPGSVLAGLFATPGAYVGKTTSALIPGSAITAYLRMNPNALKAFSTALETEIGADPEMKDLAESDVMDLIQNSMNILGTEASMSFIAGKEGGMELVQIAEVPDEAKYLEMLDDMFELFGAEGELGKFYAKLGMKLTMTLTKNARQHNGVQVHTSKTVIESKLPEQKELFDKMPTNAELALTKGLAVSANNTATMNSQLDKVAAGASMPEAALPLEALKTYGPGQPMYMDLDLISYMKLVSAMDPNLAMLKPALDKLKPGSPMTFSSNYGDGRFSFRQTVPLAPLIEFTKTMKDMMKQMAPPPAPPPPAGDGKKPVPETF